MRITCSSLVALRCYRNRGHSGNHRPALAHYIGERIKASMANRFD